MIAISYVMLDLLLGAQFVTIKDRGHQTRRSSAKKSAMVAILADRIRTALVELANAGDHVAMMCHYTAELREAFGLRSNE